MLAGAGFPAPVLRQKRNAKAPRKARKDAKGKPSRAGFSVKALKLQSLGSTFYRILPVFNLCFKKVLFVLFLLHFASLR